MTKIFILFGVALLCFFTKTTGQGVAINSNGANPHSSAMLDVNSNNKGFLIPRVSTASRKAIPNPAMGLMVFDTTESTLYMFDGNRWLGFQAMPDNIRPQSNMILPPDGIDTLYAGYSVSISNEFAVIGAPYRDLPAKFSGGAYVYRRNGDSWNLFTILSPTSGAIDTAFFGSSVNVCGNYMIIGAPYKKNAGGTHIGAAYVFHFDGSNWVNTDILWGTIDGTDYATVVDINETGTYAAVSEPGATAGNITGAGVIRVYNKGASWFLQGSLSDPSPHISEHFGTTMAMSPAGTYIIGGAPNKTVLNQSGNGAAVLFNRNGILWTWMHTFGGNGIADTRVGTFVDVTNTTILIVNGGTKIANPMTINAQWASFDYVYQDNIDGACLDPVTNDFYVWTAPAIYQGQQKVKTLSMAQQGYGVPNLFSVYNNRFAVGSPGESSPLGNYVGGYFLGVVNEH